ncbi:MAG: histidinol-phosphate aminotransferase, partial [Pseudomonadota bacterium]
AAGAAAVQVERDADPRLLRVAADVGGAVRCGVLVKHIAGLHPLLANCLRLTVGAPEENELMIAALKESL